MKMILLKVSDKSTGIGLAWPDQFKSIHEKYIQMTDMVKFQLCIEYL